MSKVYSFKEEIWSEAYSSFLRTEYKMTHIILDTKMNI